MWALAVRVISAMAVAWPVALDVRASLVMVTEDTCSNSAVALAMVLTMLDWNGTCCMVGDTADGDADCRNCIEAYRCRSSPCCYNVRTGCMADTSVNRLAYSSDNRSWVDSREPLA